MDETPILRQLLICEKLIVNKTTDNITLVECHNVRWVSRFPTEPIQFGIYGLLTNGFGTHTMQLNIMRVDTRDRVYHRVFQMRFTDRLQAKPLMGQFNIGFVFPVEGMYQIDAVADGESLGLTTLEVKRR